MNKHMNHMSEDRKADAIDLVQISQRLPMCPSSTAAGQAAPDCYGEIVSSTYNGGGLHRHDEIDTMTGFLPESKPLTGAELDHLGKFLAASKGGDAMNVE